MVTIHSNHIRSGGSGRILYGLQSFPYRLFEPTQKREIMKIEIDLDPERLKRAAKTALSTKENKIVTTAIILIIVGAYRLMFS